MNGRTNSPVHRPPTGPLPRPAGLRRLLAGVLGLVLVTFGRAEVPIVTARRPAAVIVLPDEAPAVVRYAADELVYHVQRATGAVLPIVLESSPAPASGSRIVLGDTQAARQAGMASRTLQPETFILRTAEQAVFIVGGDGSGDPLEPATFGGTLFGVYEWLERDLGIRWLWPGELGIQVPRTPTVAARDVNTTVAPAFFQRNTRGGLSFKGTHPELGFSPAAAAAYAHDQAVFLRRHRMGRGIRLSYHHAFTDWWKKYGAEHPEWFQLVHGKRGPTRPGASYSMCVSNPEFRHEIIALWRRQRAANPDLHFVNAVENGIMGLCECDACRAWDGPTPVDFLKYYPPRSKVIGSRFVTDRYVRFWLELQREAAQIDPAATVVVYNYFNYFAPPTPGMRLNRQILVGSYPSAGWFPRSADEHAWFKQQWADWQQTGARLFSRSNYCLDGYTMPLIYAHQFADEFQWQAAHGMEATDYDAITGQWAAQGPNLYVLLRLQTRPTAPVDQLLAEYYGGFGAAAPAVKAYFEFWERFALDQRTTLNAQYEDNTSRWRAFAVAAHVVFTPAAFATAGRFLAEARVATASDRDATRRVAFLEAGLTHAQLCAAVSQALSLRDPAATPPGGATALAELIAFRRAHEREWIANFNHCAWTEEASWRLAPPVPR